jgi:hypothetical protein
MRLPPAQFSPCAAFEQLSAEQLIERDDRAANELLARELSNQFPSVSLSRQLQAESLQL